jgi:hypothetical protein
MKLDENDERVCECNETSEANGTNETSETSETGHPCCNLIALFRIIDSIFSIQLIAQKWIPNLATSSSLSFQHC